MQKHNWCAWFARNKLCFEEKILDFGFIQIMAYSLITDFRRANASSSRRTGVSTAADQHVWFPPVPGVIKINTDASVATGLQTGLGGVARDDQGLALWCFAEKMSGKLDVESAEALAMLSAVKRAKELHFQNIVLETDSQVLFKALKFPSQNLSFFGLIVRDILSLRSFFEGFSFNWIRRVGNSVAHSLAYLARTIDAPLFSSTLPISCMDEYCADLQNY
ncbi:hypothetical protein ACS0TY_003244 [Phlomoides rotata]